MADPIITGGMRALWIWQGDSGLPEDRFINTWAARTSDGVAPTQADKDAFDAALLEFYTVDPAPLLFSIADRIGAHVDGSQTECRVYDLTTAPPRVPVIYDHNVTVAVAGNNQPAEVAICLSLRGASSTPRTRGRVFLGPLTDAGNEFVEGDVRPDSAFRAVIAAAAIRLQGTLQDAGLDLGIISSFTPNFVPVFGGWIDNSYDTQRRRGLDSTTRTTFSIL